MPDLSGVELDKSNVLLLVCQLLQACLSVMPMHRSLLPSCNACWCKSPSMLQNPSN